MTADRRRLRAALAAAEQRTRDQRPIERELAWLDAQIAASTRVFQKRSAAAPKPSYPGALPVAERRREIAEAIAANQVIVVCGETGSGKTTQLPKICLEMGRGVAGLIGHTQPRRIAARAVAGRISSELGSTVGHAVGYKVRFAEKVGDHTYIKLMTDGILLAETQGDRLLEQYDTLIIDEAHERSLNIDFLLGYVRELLPRRPDLKLIITSATIDPERFSRHFGDAPIVQVSGRTYPVEVRYRPIEGEDEDDRDLRLGAGVNAAIEELCAEGPGDVLVFLSGEREIREAAGALRQRHASGLEVLPLYARLSIAEQNRVFQPHRGRRIVLATNVAETSLTVPGIKYVVDPGYARISRYNPRTKVQRLPVERVSQASAKQRAGRCGRLSDGICIRLYSEEDLLDRPQFTQPEILRTNLASVILQMNALGLGDPADFPFIDRPEQKLIQDGYQTLLELQAIDERKNLSAIGRELARLPVDPRVGRMILAARDEASIDEVLIIAAALSVQDPRERPADRQESADEAHARYRDEASDFVGLLRLWDFYHEHAKHLSGSKIRKLCLTNHLSFVRMREWHDVHVQLRELVGESIQKSAAGKPQGPAREITTDKYAAIHRSLLAGLLSNVGLRGEAHEYSAARGSRFYLFPGSGVFKSKPKWVVAAELVETSRLYARTVAKIEPEWIERVAAHMIRRTHTDPHWDEEKGRVMAAETVTLFELPIVERRLVHFGPIDPKQAREIFIKSALVEEQYKTDAPFFKHNRELIDEIESIEVKSRQRNILAGMQTRYDFYDARVPAGVFTRQGFESWLKKNEKSASQLLRMTRDDLIVQGRRELEEEFFPGSLVIDGMGLPLAYRYEPGHSEDGITVTVPLSAIETIDPNRFDWMVPGFLKEKITALIRSLPKGLRANFVPIEDLAQEAYESLGTGSGPLVNALAVFLSTRRGVPVQPDAFRPSTLPLHLTMNIRVIDDRGREVAKGRDLAELRRKFAKAIEERAPAAIETAQDRTTGWTFGDIPESIESERHGVVRRLYPAVVDEGASVSIRHFDAKGTAGREMRKGLCRLYVLALRSRLKQIAADLDGLDELRRANAAIWKQLNLDDELNCAIVARAFLSDADVRTRAEFERRREEVSAGRLYEIASEAQLELGALLPLFSEVASKLAWPSPPAWAVAIGEIKEQLAQLIYPGFLALTPRGWLAEYPRYLRGIIARHKKLGTGGIKADSQRVAEIAPFWRRYLERRREHERRGVIDPELELYRWMIEEMRISLFAQELKTSIPVSAKRLETQWQKIVV